MWNEWSEWIVEFAMEGVEKQVQGLLRFHSAVARRGKSIYTLPEAFPNERTNKINFLGRLLIHSIITRVDTAYSSISHARYQLGCASCTINLILFVSLMAGISNQSTLPSSSSPHLLQNRQLASRLRRSKQATMCFLFHKWSRSSCLTYRDLRRQHWVVHKLPYFYRRVCGVVEGRVENLANTEEWQQDGIEVVFQVIVALHV